MEEIGTKEALSLKITLKDGMEYWLDVLEKKYTVTPRIKVIFFRLDKFGEVVAPLIRALDLGQPPKSPLTH